MPFKEVEAVKVLKVSDWVIEKRKEMEGKRAGGY